MFRSAALALTLCSAALTAQASLLGRVPLTPGGTDYQAYYDDVLTVTWLADANYAATNSFGIPGIQTNGIMSWNKANEWLAALNGAAFLGSRYWRLPQMQSIDGSDYVGAYSFDGSKNEGYNVTAPGSPYAGIPAADMAYLYYNTLGNPSGRKPNGFPTGCNNPPISRCLVNPGPFRNIQINNDYWYEQRLPDSTRAFTFRFNDGEQLEKSIVNFGWVWPTIEGDYFEVVPIPPAVWLFGSGLGLMGVMRRKVAK